MLYKVFAFNKYGAQLHPKVVNAKSHKDATNSVSHSGTHTLVVSQSGVAKRYNKKGKLMKGAPRYFKTSHMHEAAILVLIGTTPELFRYNTTEERNKVFACMTSTPAASANPGKEPTDITASSVETSDSKSGSTLTKTSSGSAGNVTTLVGPIHWPTDKSFGESSADDTAKDTWSSGYTASPLEQKSTWAVVNNPDPDDPSITSKMLAMNGEHVLAKEAGDYFVAEGYYWPASALKLQMSARVKRLDLETKHRNGYHDTYTTMMKEMAGQIKTFHPLGYKDWWTDGHFNWHSSWLEEV